MSHSSTYTYAILRISQAAYDEIREKISSAEQEDRFDHDGRDGCEVIDMQGIAVAVDPMLSKPLLWGKHCRGPGCDDFNEQCPSCICKCAACKPPTKLQPKLIAEICQKMIDFVNKSGQVQIRVGSNGTTWWNELCDEFESATRRR